MGVAEVLRPRLISVGVSWRWAPTLWITCSGLGGSQSLPMALVPPSQLWTLTQVGQVAGAACWEGKRRALEVGTPMAALWPRQAGALHTEAGWQEPGLRVSLF